MTREKWEAISEDLLKLNTEGRIPEMTITDVYKLIHSLDEKHGAYSAYTATIDGVIANLGQDRGDLGLLRYAKMRLKRRGKELPEHKRNYDLGTICMNMAKIKSTDSSIAEIIEIAENYESRNCFRKVNFEDPDLYYRAITNAAITLKSLGRVYEAIHLYDKALSRNPQFGMASGSKATAIEYYMRLVGYTTVDMVGMVNNLIKEALLDEKLEETGGNGVREFFAQYSERFEAFLKDKKRNSAIDETIILSDYQKFVLAKNLFLNFDFGFVYGESSLEDSFFPILFQDLRDQPAKYSKTMSEKTYDAYHLYNQILEDFTSSRYLFFHTTTTKLDEYDRGIKFVYTLDYTKHSVRYGLLKKIFSNLYGILDKIAHFLTRYLDFHPSGYKFNDINFDTLVIKEFKEQVNKSNNWQLHALYSLARDFKSDSPYSHLRVLRNRLVHGYVTVETGILMRTEGEDFLIYEDELLENTDDLFTIVKAAIIYLIVYLGEEAKKLPEKSVNLNIPLQDELYQEED